MNHLVNLVTITTLWVISISTSGKDAKKIVILKGDFENQLGKGSLIKEDIARKYSAYFHSILHHNTGYFVQVGLIWKNYDTF